MAKSVISTLIDLLRKYLINSGLIFEENNVLCGCTGRLYTIDFLVEATQPISIFQGVSNLGIILRDWKRPLGVDQVIQAERAKNEISQVDSICITGTKFSHPARILAKRARVFLLARNELEKLLKRKKVDEVGVYTNSQEISALLANIFTN